MHDEAENGIAAYWAYAQAKGTKEYRETKPIFAEKKELAWVQQLKEWQKGVAGSEEFIQSLKIDFFKDRIFTITPKGEVIDLPAGSTPVDFAYAIHTEIGDQCIGAKVNNRIVSLEHQLQSAEFKIIAEDRVGLLKDITTAISGSHINITKVFVPQTTHFPVLRIRCAVRDREKIEKLILKIKKIKGVKEVSYKLI